MNQNRERSLPPYCSCSNVLCRIRSKRQVGRVKGSTQMCHQSISELFGMMRMKMHQWRTACKLRTVSALSAHANPMFTTDVIVFVMLASHEQVAILCKAKVLPRKVTALMHFAREAASSCWLNDAVRSLTLYQLLLSECCCHYESGHCCCLQLFGFRRHTCD